MRKRVKTKRKMEGGGGEKQTRDPYKSQQLNDKWIVQLPSFPVNLCWKFSNAFFQYTHRYTLYQKLIFMIISTTFLFKKILYYFKKIDLI